jgi:hypothetical protein
MRCMDEEKIFGPLTLRQFLYSAGSFGVIFFAYTYLEPKNSVPVIIIAIILFLSAFINSSQVIIDDEYIKRKRFHYKNLEEFQRWINSKIAEVRSQINARKYRGLIPDPQLDKKLELFERALRDIK